MATHQSQQMNEKLISETEAKLMTHEEVCAQRYASIKQSFEAGDKRMTKIEYLLYAVIAAVLFGPGVAAEFVKNIIGV
jgi:hypothetical protein